MSALSVLIVDDEPLARQRLRRLLAGIADIAAIEEARDVPEAIRAIGLHRPDILLLDIRMPGGSGFDILEAIPGDLPAVIFVTAFDHYALRAFEKNAVDYVTKPIEPERLALAIARARTSLVSRNAEERLVELAETIATLRRAIRDSERQATAFWVKVRNEHIRIDLERIAYFQAERDYVRIHAGGQSYLVNENLAALERRLDADEFIRIHRSFLVRRNEIVRFRQAAFGALVAVLTDGTEVRVGKTFTKSVRDAFIKAASGQP
jgi:DNA-binding LytR/AlgR family response regulator